MKPGGQVESVDTTGDGDVIVGFRSRAAAEQVIACQPGLLRHLTMFGPGNGEGHEHSHSWAGCVVLVPSPTAYSERLEAIRSS